MQWASSHLNWGNTNVWVCKIDVYIPSAHLPGELHTVDDLRHLHEFRVVMRSRPDQGLRFYHPTPNKGGVNQVVSAVFHTALGNLTLPGTSDKRELTWLSSVPDPIKYYDCFISGKTVYLAVRDELLALASASGDKTNSIAMGLYQVLDYEIFSPHEPSADNTAIGLQFMRDEGWLLPVESRTNNNIRIDVSGEKDLFDNSNIGK